MSNHHDRPDGAAKLPGDLEARLSRLRIRAAAEGRSHAVREIDRAIEQAKQDSARKRA